jgi:RHS repeat-associated protein
MIRRLAAALALLASLAAAPAIGQSAAPPRFQEVDENGVDLISGRFVLELEEGSIGSGEGAVRLTRTQRNDYGVLDGWSAVLVTSVVGGVPRAVAYFGDRSETFNQSGGTWQPLNANGATLTATSAGLLYRASDGTAFAFTINSSTATGAPLVGGVCAGAGLNDCTLASTITRPDGTTFTLNWTFFESCPSNVPIPCEGGTAYFRFDGTSSSTGYSFSTTYDDDGGTGVGPPPGGWFVRTGATFNNAVTTPSPVPTVTYDTSTAGVEVVTDTGGRAWRIAYSGANVTGFRRPGSSADDISVSYGTGGIVSSVTRDGVTTGYSRSVSGTTATTTITNALSQQTVVVADLALERVTSVTDPLSRTTSFTYDGNARLTRVTFPEGNYIEYTYDSRGNVTQTQHVPKSGSGSPTLTTSASYPSSCTDPVTCNRPTSTTDARGAVTDYQWSATHGGIVSVTAPAPTTGATRPQTRYDYTLTNGEYRLTSISACQAGAAPACIDTADEYRAIIAYDANANVTSVTRRNGSNTISSAQTMTYDPVGNLLTVDGPLSGAADTTRYRYNGARQIVGVIGPDPDGGGSLRHRAVRTTYRADGLPIRVERGTVASQSDPDWTNFVSLEEVETDYDTNDRPVVQRLESGSTTYALTQTSYDALGRPECAAQRMNPAAFGSLPTSACTLGTEGSFGPDRIVRTTYDAAGQVTLVQTGYGVTGVQANEVATAYTNNGRVAHVTDGEANRTTYEYDGLDRLVRTRFPVTAQGQNQSSTTDYEQLTRDANGNVTTRRLRDGSEIAIAYDALNRPISKDLPGTEPTVTYAYDLIGRLISAATPAQTLSFTYDALGRNLTQAGPLGTVTSTWDAAHRRTRLDYASNGFFLTYGYNLYNETTEIRARTGQSDEHLVATYAYDDRGRRTSLTRGNDVATTYGYDDVSRLTSLAHNPSGTTHDLTISLAYNPAGQIVTRTLSNSLYAFPLANQNVAESVNGLNQLTAVNSTSVTHDARGNLISDGSRSYSYSSENLLTSSTAGSVTTTMAYDPLLRLYDTGSAAFPTQWAYDGANLLEEQLTGAGRIFRYAHGVGLAEPLVAYQLNPSTGAVNQRNWTLQDERGSVIAMTDNTGAAHSLNAYDDYGVAASQPGRFNYTGQPAFVDFPALYLRNRVYAPALGRFLQPDPIGYTAGMNLYAYVRGDPVNFFDPLGLDNCTLTQCEVWGTPVRPSGAGGVRSVGGSGRFNLSMPITETGGGDNLITCQIDVGRMARVTGADAAAAAAQAAQAGRIAVPSLPLGTAGALGLTLGLSGSSHESPEDRAFVIRGGLSAPQTLLANFLRSASAGRPGVSAHSIVNMSPEGIAFAVGGFRNAMITVTTRDALWGMGFSVTPTPGPGNEYHVTIARWPNPTQFTMEDAIRLSQAFEPRTNPCRIP